jgi:small-conductance mechanosensitive channel
MDTFAEVFNTLVVQSLNQAYTFTLQHGPGIVFALAVILFGWICAVVLRKIITKLLRAFGFDVLSARIGFKRFLEKGGIDKAPSSLIGWIFYWMVFLNALIMAQDVVDLKVTSQFIQNIILYIPNVIVGIIILTLGIYVSRFMAKFVDKTAHLAGIPVHSLLGTIARYAILGLTAIVILDYSGVPSLIMSESITIIFAVIPIGFFLVFLVGGRDVISNIISGRCLTQVLNQGDHVECDSAAGTVEKIGATTTVLKNGTVEIIIPNAELAKKIIKKK